VIIPIETEQNLLAGLTEYYETADILFAESTKTSQIACESGCSFCCSLHVTTKPYEILPLVRFTESLAPVQRERFDLIVAHNRELLGKTDDERIIAVNFTCPFLLNHACAVYSMRPLSCRVAHSLSQNVCEQAFNSPDSAIEADTIRSCTESMRALEDEFEEILGEYYDVSDYNMYESLFEALLDPEWISRFLEGEEVFSDTALSRI